MPKRSLLRAVLGAYMLAAVFAPTASADTITDLTDVVVAGAGFTFDDRGVTYSGIVQIEENRLTGTTAGSVFFRADGTERTCYVGTPDEYMARDTIEWFAESFDVRSVAIRDDLAAGKFEYRARGPRLTIDACTGEIASSRTERHTFAVAMKGIGEATSETNSDLVRLEDGQIVPGTDTYSARAATGKVSIGSISGVMTDALLQRVLVIANP
jgi:hypothetical protein